MRTAYRDLLFDDDGAHALATRAGAHGVYVRNALAAAEGDGFVVARGGKDAGLVWLGPRGNLVIVAVGEALYGASSGIAD